MRAGVESLSDAAVTALRDARRSMPSVTARRAGLLAGGAAVTPRHTALINQPPPCMQAARVFSCKAATSRRPQGMHELRGVPAQRRSARTWRRRHGPLGTPRRRRGLAAARFCGMHQASGSVCAQDTLPDERRAGDGFLEGTCASTGAAARHARERDVRAARDVVAADARPAP